MSTVPPSATWDEKALERASFELQGHFGREGSIYGIKACEEIARIAIVAYDRSKSRPPRTTSTWLAAVFEDMCESLPDAVSARLHADIDAIHRILSTRSETLTSADYEEVLADHRRLVREIDVLLNGEAGAAKQASLCDLIPQIRDLVVGE